jgi:hypothetical protein
MFWNRYRETTTIGEAAKFEAETSAVAEVNDCFGSSVPGMKLTIIGQQSNFVAEIDGSSLFEGFVLSQCLSCFGSGQCWMPAFRTTLRQYATQTAPPAFMHTKISRNAEMNFAWKGFGIIEPSTI